MKSESSIGTAPKDEVLYRKNDYSLTVCYTTRTVVLKNPLGEHIAFTLKEEQVAGIIICRKDKTISVAEVTKELYGPSSTRNTVKVFVFRLREKLGPFSDCIQTIGKRGYRWVKPQQS